MVDLYTHRGKGVTRESNVIHMRVAILAWAPAYGKAEVILKQGRISMKNRIVGRDLLGGQVLLVGREVRGYIEFRPHPVFNGLPDSAQAL
jgi:hypothetical protein